MYLVTRSHPSNQRPNRKLLWGHLDKGAKNARQGPHWRLHTTKKKQMRSGTEMSGKEPSTSEERSLAPITHKTRTIWTTRSDKLGRQFLNETYCLFVLFVVSWLISFLNIYLFLPFVAQKWADSTFWLFIFHHLQTVYGLFIMSSNVLHQITEIIIVTSPIRYHYDF